MDRNKTTLCYIENDNNEWLFIYKNRSGDPNNGKYLGIGGHVELDEPIRDCMVREIQEETSLVEDIDYSNLNQMGTVHFINGNYEEDMYVFVATFIGQDLVRNRCDEGELSWISKEDADNLPIWEGDRLIFDYLRRNKQFHLRLVYKDEKLVESANLLLE